ncbi:YceI family protein [Marinobacterium maritimum]
MLSLLAGCAPQVEQQPFVLPSQPAEFPSDIYLGAAHRAQRVYRVDASRSLVVVRVYRGGRFANLGHDHVVASHQVQGLILWSEDWQSRRADLFAPLASLTVDEAALRQEYALTTQPSERDVAGTRDNMLNKTLRVSANPFVSLHIQALSEVLPTMPVQAEISLNGIVRSKRLDVQVEQKPGEMWFSGAFSLTQTEFGLEPYSLLGGLLRVEDEVDISFKLVAVEFIPGE